MNILQKEGLVKILGMIWKVQSTILKHLRSRIYSVRNTIGSIRNILDIYSWSYHTSNESTTGKGTMSEWTLPKALLEREMFAKLADTTKYLSTNSTKRYKSERLGTEKKLNQTTRNMKKLDENAVVSFKCVSLMDDLRKAGETLLSTVKTSRNR